MHTIIFRGTLNKKATLLNTDRPGRAAEMSYAEMGELTIELEVNKRDTPFYRFKICPAIEKTLGPL